MKRCPFCAVEIQDAAIVCRYCGREVPTSGVSLTGPAPSVGDGASGDAPYGSGMVLGAALLTVFMPFIALIAALLLRGSETRPQRRGFLKTWAIASGVWLATGWLLVVMLFSSFSIGGNTCKGGIDRFAPPVRYTSSDNEHWTGTFACVDGGTTTTTTVPDPFPNQ